MWKSFTQLNNVCTILEQICEYKNPHSISENHAIKSLSLDFWSILYHFYSNIGIKIWPRNNYYLADSSGIDCSFLVFIMRVPPPGPIKYDLQSKHAFL